jgi:hypothetical protein
MYFCVLIVFSLHRESLKLILVDEPLAEGILSQESHQWKPVLMLSHQFQGSIFLSSLHAPMVASWSRM